jgi:DNA-binding response OmpR family regulator
VPTILIAEDDPRISSFLQKGLRASGYGTVIAEDGETAERLAITGDFDLLILDIGLPDRDGYRVLQSIRARGKHFPVIVVTGRHDRDVVAYLDGGADDFMTKPFRFDELLARVKRRIRPPIASSPDVLRVDDIRLDLRTRRASIGDRTIELTGREFALLEMFLRHADQVLSREQLLSQVWGYYFDPETNVVNVYVHALRQKLGRDVIESVRGTGYRLRPRKKVLM